jgi:hypothetical protein
MAHPSEELLRCWNAQFMFVNVTVVNIDNGFGAGFVASLINRRWQPPAE